MLDPEKSSPDLKNVVKFSRILKSENNQFISARTPMVRIYVWNKNSSDKKCPLFTIALIQAG